MALEILIAASVLAATFLYYLIVMRNSKVNKFLRQVSGPPQLPLLGNMLDFNIPNEGKSLDSYQNYAVGRRSSSRLLR